MELNVTDHFTQVPSLLHKIYMRRVLWNKLLKSWEDLNLISWERQPLMFKGPCNKSVTFYNN